MAGEAERNRRVVAGWPRQKSGLVVMVAAGASVNGAGGPGPSRLFRNAWRLGAVHTVLPPFWFSPWEGMPDDAVETHAGRAKRTAMLRS